MIEKKFVLIYTIFFCFFGTGLLGLGDFARADTSQSYISQYKEASKNYHLLYEVGEFRKYEHNWKNTIVQFEKIYKNHPQTIYAPKSLYNIGNLYTSLYRWNKKKENLDHSTRYFQKIIDQYPKNYLADDAVFRIGENYLLQNNSQKARVYFQKLIKKHPKSLLIKDAKIALLAIAKEKIPPPPPKTKTAKTKTAKTKTAKTTLNSHSAQIKDLDYFTTASWTRVILTLDKKADYTYQALEKNQKQKKPPRFYIDIQNTILPKEFKKKIVSSNGIIRKLRIAQFNPQTTRLVIDLYTLTETKVFATNLGKEHKIIIDILGDSDSSQLNAILNELKQDNNKSSNVNLAEAFGLKVKRIIIDPGHGGKDPGAVGGNQYYEKKIVLRLALMLKKELQKALPKINILLTRDTDRFISLEKRTAFANSKKGDLFISLHCNALKNTKVRGIETYYLSLTKNQTALNLAARENSSSLKNISDLQAILNDLINQTKVPESKKLAELVQKNIIQKLKENYSPRDLGVKKAPFLVLVGSQMPSILIETGFVTNKNERMLLSRSRYLQKISQGITKGVVSYTQAIGKI